MKLAVVVVAALAAGVTAGWALRPVVETARTPSEPAPTAQAPSAQAPSPAFESARLGQLLRGIVREELARANPSPAGQPEPAPPPPAERTAEAAAAGARGHAIVEGARRAGRWTDDDAQHLREVLPQLDDAQRGELLATLVPAINRQELKVETQGPPF